MGDNIKTKVLFVGLLILSYGLIVSSAVENSATVDEQSHLFRGVAYIKTGATHFLLGHPLLGGTLSALPLLTERTIKLPEDDPSWDAGNWSVAADSFLWKLNDNPQRLIFLGRLAVMWLTLFLGALVFRWGLEMAGKGAAMVAAALFLLDPNVLAHGKLITSDIPVSLFITLSIYGYWRFSRYRISNGQWINLVICGVSMGLAAATKFNAAILIPIFALLGIWLAVKERSWRPILGLLFAVVIAWIVVWLVYGMAWRPLPGGAFWDDLFWEIRYFDKPHGAYLAGQYSVDGWWYYFPLTFLLKTPLPTLILLVAAIILAITGMRSLRDDKKKNQSIHQLIFLSAPPLLYILASLITSLNIGYRYLLPMFPFLVLFIGFTLSKRWTGTLSPSRAVRWLPVPFIIILLIISVVVWPDYISYFNLIAGGQDGGWRILSDSNVDWGQDLPALARWQREDGRQLNLSYFGTAHPSAYGIDYKSLPTWAPGPEQTPRFRQEFNPNDPAPGLYAISITNLHGVVLGEERDIYQKFREIEPLEKIGGSIFIYELKPTGEPMNVSFSGLRPADLAPNLSQLFESNDLRIRWFDAKDSLIFPSGGGWIAIPSNFEIDLALQRFWPIDPVIASQGQSLFKFGYPENLELSGIPTDFDSTLTLLGYEPIASSDGEVSLMTAWEVLAETEKNLKVFVHALDEQGQIIGQWDGLSVYPDSLQIGDIILQYHRFLVSPEVGMGAIMIGVYDGDTLERLGTPINIDPFLES